MPFPIDEKYIVITEEKLGVVFPASFRNKMIKENGGEVETPPDAWQLYPFLDSSSMKRIKRTCNDIIRETESARKWDIFPQDAVAIGSNGGGDQLVLLPSENSKVLQDAIYWWDHETGNISKVAGDFKSLEKKR